MEKDKHSVNEEQVRTVFEYAGIPVQTVKLERIENGFCNPVYKIVADDKPYILKVTNPVWQKLKTVNEAVVLKFVSEHTSIPAPKVYAYSNTTELIGYEFILMECMHGVAFSDIIEGLSLEERKPYLQQIAQYYATMVALEIESSNEYAFGCFEKLEKIDNRLIATLCPNVDSLKGPYTDLYSYIIDTIQVRLPGMEKTKYKHYVPQFMAIIEKLREEQRNTTHNERLVLTHTDLAPKNIIVDPSTSTVTGIIDWEWCCMMVTDQDFPTVTESDDWGDEDAKSYLREQVKERLSETLYNDFQEKLESRMHILDADSYAMRVVAYPEWHVGREHEIPEYEEGLEKGVANLFAQFNL
jgi:serine/threonine protein kinase